MAPCSSTLATKSIDDLSDWDLLELMKRLPIIELVHLGGVNRRFNELSKKCYPARKELVLVICDHPQVMAAAKRHSMLNVIHLPMLTDHNVECLQSLLPAIIGLAIVNFNSRGEQIAPLIHLLRGLSTQLVMLSVEFGYSLDGTHSPSALLDAINGLSKLTTLHLIYNDQFIDNGNEEAATFNLPIISQLQKVSFSSYDSGDLILAEIVKRASDNDKLTEVKLSNRLSEHSSRELLLNLKPQLASAFKELDLNDDYLNFRQLKAFCSQFTNLTKLTIGIYVPTIRQVNSALVLLPKLKHLGLVMDFIHRTIIRNGMNEMMDVSEEVMEAIEAIDANIPLLLEDFEPDTTDASTLVPLKSVTKLNLQLALARHDDLMLLHLAVLLPNVDTLNFNIIHCGQCGWNADNLNKANYEGRRRCLQKTSAHWRMLPKLRKVTLFKRRIPEEDWQTSSSSTANDGSSDLNKFNSEGTQ